MALYSDFDLPVTTAYFRARLDVVRGTVEEYWASSPGYGHFTYQGLSHSARVFRLIGQIGRLLPSEHQLREEEWFVIAASSCLYEVGLQSKELAAALGERDKALQLSSAQLAAIRGNRAQLTKQTILSAPSLCGNSVADEYTTLVVAVCLQAANDVNLSVEDLQPVRAQIVRISLLAALLGLADELYIDRDRVHFERLERAGLSGADWAFWMSLAYTSVLPIDKGEIRFHYSLPDILKEYLSQIRMIVEPPFYYQQNRRMRFLREYDLALVPPYRPSLGSAARTHVVGETEFVAYLAKQRELNVGMELVELKDSERAGLLGIEPSPLTDGEKPTNVSLNTKTATQEGTIRQTHQPKLAAKLNQDAESGSDGPVKTKRFNWKRLVVGIVMAGVAYVVSLWLWPQWDGSWRTQAALLVAVIIGVTAFLDSARGAYGS